MTGDDTQILQRLSATESDLLKLSRSSLVGFHQRWILLVDDLQIAIDAKRLAPSTVTAAHALAARVSKMIQTFLDLEILSEQLMASLLEENSPVVDSSVPPKPEPFHHALPPYLRLSYDWLMDHLHNPYPSQQVRDAIAKKSRSARKDVDNWFIHARKRIGWNDARKIHFSNKRAQIVEAATRFYANDEKLSLSQGAEHALVSIMRNAKDLYSDKFGETVLASRLASVIKDLTPKAKAEAKAEQIRTTQSKKDRDPYPSPDRSPGPAYPSLMPCNDEVVAIATPVTCQKRRNPSTEPVEVDVNGENRQEKRLRLEVSTPSFKDVALPLGLPSPALSIDEPLCGTEPVNKPSLSSSAPHTLARLKRRLSESDDQGVFKRPCHLSNGTRLQPVSYQSPISNDLLFDETSFDGWFQQIFDRPEAEKTCPSGFAVELGDLSDLNHQTSTLPNIEQTFKPSTIKVADISTVLNMPSNDFGLGWTDLPLSSDNLKQSHSMVSFVGPDTSPKPLAQNLANFQISPQVSRATNEFESLFGLSNFSIIDPAAIPLDPTSHEAWHFPESAINRIDTTIFGKHADFESNIGLPVPFDFPNGADLSPTPNTSILPTSGQDKLRQEKEEEFREACEKAQRLALELQKGDLFA